MPPDTNFFNGSGGVTKWHETIQNMSFRPKVVDWECSLRNKKKWFWWHKRMPCMHPDTRFRNGSHPATKWHETNANMGFGSKVVDWACSLWKNKKWFRRHKLMPCMHPDTRFRNGLRAATKWHETTPNMSFGPKVVDWACSLQKHKKWFRLHKLLPCMHRDTYFRNGSRAATKWRETAPKLEFWT